MDRLQVLRHEVRVATRHLQAGMAEYPLQMEHSTATPQVVYRKRVPERVQCPCRRIELKLLAERFHISKDNAPAQSVTSPCREEKFLRVQISAVADQHPAQFEREWQASLFASLACDGE